MPYFFSNPEHGAFVNAYGLYWGIWPGKHRAIYYAHDIHSGDRRGGKYYSTDNSTCTIWPVFWWTYR